MTLIRRFNRDELVGIDIVASCVEGLLRPHILADLHDNQFAALICFASGVQLHVFAQTMLRAKLNLGRIEEAAEEFPKWNHRRGRIKRELVIRREAEQELFLRAPVAAESPATSSAAHSPGA